MLIKTPPLPAKLDSKEGRKWLKDLASTRGRIAVSNEGLNFSASGDGNWYEILSWSLLWSSLNAGTQLTAIKPISSNVGRYHVRILGAITGNALDRNFRVLIDGSAVASLPALNIAGTNTYILDAELIPRGGGFGFVALELKTSDPTFPISSINGFNLIASSLNSFTLSVEAKVAIGSGSTTATFVELDYTLPPQ